MGTYDYDNDSIGEIFIFHDEYIDIYNPDGSIELIINLTSVINEQGIRALYYCFRGKYLYLSSIYVISSPLNHSYWIVSFIKIDLLNGKALFNEPKIISGLPGFVPPTNEGIPGLYKLHIIDDKYVFVYYNGFSLETNPIIFGIYNFENKTLYYRIVYEHKDFPTLTLPATHMITSALTPGGEDPYPLVHINNSYIIIMPNKEIYVFYPNNGSLVKFGILNINEDCIVKYVYIGGGKVLVLAGPIDSTNPMRLSIYKYYLESVEANRLSSFNISNADYGRLVVQSLVFNDVKGFFIRLLTLPESNSPEQEYQSRFTPLSLFFISTNDSYMFINLTSNTRPVSQLFNIGKELYAYMVDSFNLRILDPVGLSIGEYNIEFISGYFIGDVPCYVVYRYDDSSLIVIGVKYIGIYHYYSEILIVNYRLNILDIEMRPLNELNISLIMLSSTIILLLLRRNQSK